MIPARYGRLVRRAVVGFFLVVLAACSGGDDDSGPVVSPATTGDDVATTQPTDENPESTSDSSGAVGSEPTTQTVSVSVRSDSIDGEITVEQVGDGDPFATFGSCSGLRSRVGPYSVLASDTIGPVRSISLLTGAAVDGPGTHDADVRVERAVGDPIVATGTVTLASGLAAGSYLAFTPDGEPVEGDFECSGSQSPEPLEVGPADGTLDAIEVFALLRQGDAERVLGLAVTSDTAPTAQCPGAGGGSDDSVIVRVDGDESIGAITTFELTGGATSTMRLRAGGVVYEFDRVEVELDESAASGIFSASTQSGIAVDGAFRCT